MNSIILTTNIDPSAKTGHFTFIGKDTVISKKVIVGNNVNIGENVFLGEGVIIHPFVNIADNVVIKEAVEIFSGSVIGKEPKGAGALARTPEYEEKVLIGKDCSIGPNAIIYYDVEVGENSLIGDGASIREKCTVGSKCIISRYVTVNYNSSIGNNTKIMDMTHITGNCVIEEDVFISILVGTVNDNLIGKAGYDESRIQGPHIKKGATIGAGATILPSVVIGENSIVGAGSVATKDVNDNSKVMGIPAKEK